MFEVSGRWEPTIRGPHRMVTYVDLLLADGTTVRSDTVSGSVTIDRTSEVRRTATIAIAIPDAIAPTIEQRLRLADPYRTRVQVWRGLAYADGTEEMVPLGYFWIDTLAWSADQTLINLTCSDQTSVIQQAEMPFSRIIKGDSTISIISALLNETYSQRWNDLSPTDNLILAPGVIDEALAETVVTGNRWEAIRSLAAGLGCDIYADAASTKFHLSPVPSIDRAAPVYRVDAGEDGVLIDYTKTLSREGVYNSVITRAENVTTMEYAVYGIAEVTNPIAPTFVGTYGRSVLIEENNLYNTTSKAQRAAEGILANSQGLTASLDLSTIPNPALDVGDAIEVAYVTTSR